MTREMPAPLSGRLYHLELDVYNGDLPGRRTSYCGRHGIWSADPSTRAVFLTHKEVVAFAEASGVDHYNVRYVLVEFEGDGPDDGGEVSL